MNRKKGRRMNGEERNIKACDNQRNIVDIITKKRRAETLRKMYWQIGYTAEGYEKERNHVDVNQK